MRAWGDMAPIPLRLMLGFGYMYHGYPKLFSTAGHDGFVGMLAGLGIPLPEAMAWLVGVLEFFGGLALLAGAFVAVVAALLIVNMLVAMFAVHWEAGFNFMNMAADGSFGMPGYEVPLLYIAGLVALALGGAGIWSVDRARRERAAARPDPALAPAA